MKFRVCPHTGLGKFSTITLLVFAGSLLLRVLQIDDMLEILAFFTEYLSGAVAWLSGLISILFYKERSIIVLSYTFLPLVIILFIIVRSI